MDREITHSTARYALRGNARCGFTLIEILIVVVILGILAAIVVPQFVSAADNARGNSIHMSVHRIREQLQIYQQHHDGRWPTLAAFEAQMTGQTDITGAAGTIFGPYIREVPFNSNSGTNTISDGAIGTSAWYYDESSGDFRANDSVETNAY